MYPDGWHHYRNNYCRQIGRAPIASGDQGGDKRLTLTQNDTICEIAFGAQVDHGKTSTSESKTQFVIGARRSALTAQWHVRLRGQGRHTSLWPQHAN